jgi:hypothetical protein
MPSDTAPKFAIRNLSVLNYAQGFTSWHYRGNETTAGATITPPIDMADVEREGFFDAACKMLTRGDMMMVSASDGGCMLYVRSVEPTVRVSVMCLTAGEHTP